MGLIHGVIGGGLLLIAVVLAIPVVTIAVQVLASLVDPKARDRSASTSEGAASFPSFAVLMPAHDEAVGIAAPIASVLAQLGTSGRLLVVADNCSDTTAAVAKAAGAEVVERHDPARRGKGYALDCGIRRLALAPPDVVVVVDADCIARAGALDRVVAESSRSGRPVQALYLMHAPPGAPLTTRIAEFAWVVKNQVRATGSHRLGLPCQLMGSGMAFPWAVISEAKLATGHIVEDLQLGLALAAEGAPPLFCPEALVTSTFPTTGAGLATQKTRWEHGHLSVIVAMAPALLWQATRRRRWALVALVFDLCVPPLASLAGAMLIVVVAAAALAWAGGAVAPLIVATVTLMVWTVVIALAWHAYGRRVLTLRELASMPAYVLRKIPDYVRFFHRRETRWIRTERDDGKR